MLHYSVDNELMSDLYRDYRQMKGAEYAQLHELGEHYLSLIEGYDLEESTIKTLQGLVQFETEEELESVENGIVHGYLTAKAALRKEQAEYKEFVRMFDGEQQQALNGLSEYVVGQKKIPYKIKNRILHVDVLSTPAMSLELDFADVLIEDGRHPRILSKVRMTDIKPVFTCSVNPDFIPFHIMDHPMLHGQPVLKMFR